MKEPTLRVREVQYIKQYYRIKIMKWYKNYDDYYDDYEGWGRTIFRKSYQSSIGNSGELSRAVNHESGYKYKSWESVGVKEDTDTSKLIVKAYSSVKDMITIMDFPFSIKINLKEIEKDSSSYSDDFDSTVEDINQRRIFIPTNIFDSSETKETKINAFCGFGIHEAAHLRYTYYRVYRDFVNYLSSTESYIEHKDMIKIFINLLEDNRVEDLLLTERPGFQEFISTSKEYNSGIFEKSFKSIIDSEKDFPEVIKFLKTLVGILRFPGLIEKEILENYSEVYKKIQEKITPYPETLKDICSISKDIFRIIESDICKDINADILARLLFRVTKKINNIEVLVETMYGTDIDSGKIGGTKYVSNLLKSSSSVTIKILEGTLERGDSDNTFFEKPKGDRNKYLMDVCEIKKYIPRLRKILTGTDKNYDFNISGCRSGLLDTTKLAEAYQGVPQVYLRQGHVRTNKSTICVLIDESGSMGGRKEVLARKAATLLNETFGKSAGVDLYIYGHTADIGSIGYVNLSIYREGNHYAPKFSISSSKAKSQNRDGDAILEVAKRVRKFTKEHCIMFVISDGCPCANGYGGASAIIDTAEKVKEAEKLDFGIVQVSIDAVYGVSQMFDTYIDIGYDLEAMPKLLNEIIKTKVLDNKKTVII